MIRVAFTLAGGTAHWTGGFNFLRNAFRVLREWRRERVTPVLFVGPELSEAEVAMLAAELDEQVVRAGWLGTDARRARLVRAVATGCDRIAADAFGERSIDVAFEAGEYFGVRFPFPTLTWVADFQSHHLPHMFSRRARWRTSLGRHLQLLGPRTILLSSEDAQRDCLQFYRRSAGRTVVVPFAVLPRPRPLPAPKLLASYALPDRFLFLPNQWWKHKNHIVVIDALVSALRQRPDMVIAASGSPVDLRHPGHKANLEARIAQLGVGHAFRVLGLIPAEDVAGLMELSVALVNPSLFEGWSTTVEEAKSLGVPLVLSSLGVHREQAGPLARYFDPASPESAARALIAAWDCSVDAPATRRELAAPWVATRTAQYAERLEGAFALTLQRFGSGPRHR